MSYFEFTPSDRAMAALELSYPSLIHLVVDLEGELDLPRLETAWQRLPVCHPILACSAAWRGFARRWRPGTARPPEFTLESESEGAPAVPGAVESRLLGTPLDVAHGPLARLAVLRRPDATRLLVTVHHAVMDAWGLLEIVADLQRLYEALETRPDFQPARDPRPRTTRALLRSAGISAREKRRLLWQAERDDRRRLTSTHRRPQDAAGARSVDGPMTYARIDFEPGQMAALKPVRAHHGWTVNDVLLGLLSWSWLHVFGHDEGRSATSGWVVAANLRDRLRSAGGPGVLSGLEFVALEGLEGRDLGQTIAEAKRVMDRYKQGIPGLGTHIQLSMLQAIAPGPLFNLCFALGHRYRYGVKRYERTFTNIGPLPDHLARWGAARATRAYVLAPLGSPPATIVSASSFGGTLSVMVGYQHPWLSDAQVEQLTRQMHAGMDSLLEPQR